MTPERWARLKGLFNQALDVDQPERPAFIAEACGDDAALARSLASLLRHHASGASLDEAASGARAGDPAAARRAFSVGDVVADRFVVQAFLAQGGMGEVYAAEDLDLNELVALKTIRPALATDEEIVDRFRQEILLARRVTHRNVARVFDLFRHHDVARADGRPVLFLSMELLKGETLPQRIRRLGRLRAREAAPIAVQLVAGLEAAHKAGVLHRDFKSSNVALVPDDRIPEDERAVIMDFGLASLLESVSGHGSGAMAGGTPAYMAPEQVEGHPVSQATDTYALGVVLFEMLAGVVPFTADSPAGAARLRLSSDPPALRELVPSTPRIWSRVVRDCLQRDPARRPSLAEVASGITGRRRRRQAIRATVLAAGVVALAAGGWQWARRPHQPNPAAQDFVDTARVKRETITQTGYAGAINDLREAIRLDPRWGQPWAELAYTYAAAANVQQIPAAVARKEARAAALRAIELEPRSAKAFGALGWVQSLDFDDWPNAEENLRRALVLDGNDEQVHYWLGVHLRKIGRFGEAERETREAMRLSRRREPAHWFELAFLYWTSGQRDRLEATIQELLVAYPNSGFTRFLHARLLKEQGKYEEALAELRFSEKLQYSPVTILVEYASLEACRGNVHAAQEYLRRLADISKTRPVDTLLIAGAYVTLNDRDSAMRWLEQGYAQRDSTLLSIATSPLVAPLRDDDRFRALLERLHFQPD